MDILSDKNDELLRELKKLKTEQSEHSLRIKLIQDQHQIHTEDMNKKFINLTEKINVLFLEKVLEKKKSSKKEGKKTSKAPKKVKNKEDSEDSSDNN